MSAYEIVTVEKNHTAVVPAHVAFAELPNAERSARRALAEALPRPDVAPTGDTFTLSRAPADGRIYIEPGVIVARPFAPIGEVVASSLPAGRAVRYLLIGPFDQLPQAWPALFAWCRQHGHKTEGTFWQVYGPHAADPAQQETTLYALLAEQRERERNTLP